jgi:hypothetical protein
MTNNNVSRAVISASLAIAIGIVVGSRSGSNHD